MVIMQLQELVSRNLIKEMEKGGYVRHVLDEKTGLLINSFGHDYNSWLLLKSCSAFTKGTSFI